VNQVQGNRHPRLWEKNGLYFSQYLLFSLYKPYIYIYIYRERERERERGSIWICDFKRYNLKTVILKCAIWKSAIKYLTKLQFDFQNCRLAFKILFFQKSIQLSAIWKISFLRFQITIFLKNVIFKQFHFLRFGLKLHFWGLLSVEWRLDTEAFFFWVSQ